MVDARARRVVAEHLGIPVALGVDAVAFSDLGADSLDLIELTMALEHAFDVRIPDDDAHRCSTVGDAMALLKGHLGDAMAAAAHRGSPSAARLGDRPWRTSPAPSRSGSSRS